MKRLHAHNSNAQALSFTTNSKGPHPEKIKPSSLTLLQLCSMLFACLITLKISAQSSYFCYGVIPDTSGGVQGISSTCPGVIYAAKYGKLPRYIPQATDSVRTVNITLHIFTPSAPNQHSGEFDSSNSVINGIPRIMHLMSTITEGHDERYSDVAKNTYDITPVSYATSPSDSRIKYHLTNIYFYANTHLDTLKTGQGANTALRNYIGHIEEGIPIIISRGSSANAWFTSVFTSVTAGDSASFRGQLLHELGHCFGLGHPYYGGTYNPTTHTGTPSQFPETINCNSIDFLSDLFPLNNPSCSHRLPSDPPSDFGCGCSCGACYESRGYDTNNDTIVYGTNNFMGEGPFYPRHWITPLQMARKRRAMRFESVRSYVQDVVSDHVNVWDIDTSEVWDMDIQMYEDIVVHSGAKLTISCKVYMPIGGKIVVEKGAQLFISGGEVHGWCRNGLWGGIELEGDANQKQRVNSAGFCAGHAVLKIDHGKIMNSENAIKTYLTDSIGRIRWSTLGGIVTASVSIFGNNTRSAEFLTFSDSLSASGFTDCAFAWDSGGIGRTTAGNMAQPLAHVTLWGIDGVKFVGCQFVYQAGSTYTFQGEGIGSLDASYTIKAHTGPNGLSQFIGLKTGINAINSNPLSVVNISGTTFSNTVQDGLFIKNMQGFFVYNNKFYNNYGNGAYLRSCGQYTVSSNVFSQSANPPSSTGIYIYNSGPGSHQLYRNTFSRLSGGILPVGNNAGVGSVNTGLKMNCNSFGSSVTATSNRFDIAMMKGPLGGTWPPVAILNSWPTVNNRQGAATSPYTQVGDLVRNVYGAASSCTNCENQWYIEGTSIAQISHPSASLSAATQPTPQPAFSDYSVNVVPVPVTFNYTSACPIVTLGAIMADSYYAIASLSADNKDGQHDFEISSIVAGQLTYFLNDSIHANLDSVIALLESNRGNYLPNTKILSVYASIRKNDLTTAQAKINALSGTNANWKPLLNKQLYYKTHPQDLYELQSNNDDVEFFEGYAAFDTINGAAAAQAILQHFGGVVHYEPRPFPETGGAGRLMQPQTDTITTHPVQLKNGKLLVFPNPANELLQVSYTAEEEKMLRIELTNTLGQKVYENTIHANTLLTISLSGTTNGVYLFNAYDGKLPVYQTRIICIK